ncbi:MAG: hypothetical protein ABI551_17070, partial [Polyangiaceae bacterium]
SALCAFGAIAGGGVAERILLACASLGIAAFGVRKFAERHRAARETGFVVLDERGIARKQGGKSTVLAEWKAPFGVSLFASKSGDRGLIAFTSDGATRYLGVHVPDDDYAAATMLFDRSAIRADDDALFSQGVDQSLRATNAAALLSALESREPNAMSRVFLTSIRGEALVVSGNGLKVGERDFDLRAPLEWRPFLFHEVAGQVTTIYQATWLRQETAGRTSEIVLVAPLPATSDVRLSPSLADIPPARDVRIAIERLFMPVVRRALERSTPAVRSSLALVRKPAAAKGPVSSGA